MYHSDLIHIWMCTLQGSGRWQLVYEIAQFDWELGKGLWGSPRCRGLR